MSRAAFAALAACVLATGCAHHCRSTCEPSACRRSDSYARPIVVTESPVPSSALFDGRGLDPIALAVGRTDWPSAPRDFFEGERGSYYEYFLDVQRTPVGPFWFDDGGYTLRQFRSDRVGGFRR